MVQCRPTTRALPSNKATVHPNPVVCLPELIRCSLSVQCKPCRNRILSSKVGSDQTKVFLSICLRFSPSIPKLWEQSRGWRQQALPGATGQGEDVWLSSQQGCWGPHLSSLPHRHFLRTPNPSLVLRALGSSEGREPLH